MEKCKELIFEEVMVVATFGGRCGGGDKAHRDSPGVSGKVLFLYLHGIYNGICSTCKTPLSYIFVGCGFLYLYFILQWPRLKENCNPSKKAQMLLLCKEYEPLKEVGLDLGPTLPQKKKEKKH